MFGPAATSLPMASRTLIGNAEFRRAFAEASAVVERRRGWSPWREIDKDGAPHGVSIVERYFVEETLLQLCLFRAFAETNTRYDAVAGVSLGDAAAGFASGALTFDEALHVMCATIAAVQNATGGDLVAVTASPQRVQEIIGESAALPVIHWPVFSVWAVPDDSARTMQRRLRAARVPYTRLGFNCLSHTDRIDVDALEAAIDSVDERAPSTPYYSTLEGGVVQRDAIPRRRWARSIAEPVRLHDLWESLRRSHLTDIIYIGSIPLDKDLFPGLPRHQRPTSFRTAQSFVAIDKSRPSAFDETKGVSSPDMESVFRSAGFARDPYPFYRQWLSEGAVHRMGEEKLFAAFSYDSAMTVLKQPQIFSTRMFKVMSPVLAGVDPPEHTRVRRVLNPYFSRDRILLQRDWIGRMTEEVFSKSRRNREIDFVSDFAGQLPFSISCRLLGLNESDAVTIGMTRSDEVVWDDVQRGLRDEGVIPDIVASGELSHDDVCQLLPFLIGAGVTTMRDLLSFALRRLMREPEVVSHLAADRALMPQAIEELIRLETGVHGDARIAVTDTVVEGVDVPEGSIVWVWLGSVCRDPSKFPDPDKFMLNRELPRHLAFGIGPHFCLGTHLAKLETELVLDQLIHHIPRVRELSEPDFYFEDIRGNPPQPVLRSMRSWRVRIE
jgi:cytochrome P450